MNVKTAWLSTPPSTQAANHTTYKLFNIFNGKPNVINEMMNQCDKANSLKENFNCISIEHVSIKKGIMLLI